MELPVVFFFFSFCATAQRGRSDGGDSPLRARPGAAASARPGGAGTGAAGVSAGGHLGRAIRGVHAPPTNAPRFDSSKMPA